VLLGVLAGNSLVHAYAQACSCAAPSWHLDLDSSTEPDPSIWPASAYLQQGSGPIELRASGSAAKVDYLRGGKW
jgi:hypothetical protein